MGTAASRRYRLPVWVRAVDCSVVPFAVVYGMGVALLWGDGSVLTLERDALSALGGWLCFGWLPASAAAIAGFVWTAYRGGLAPWTARQRGAFGAAFVLGLPFALMGVEAGVHALHRERVHCEGQLYCSVAPPPRPVVVEDAEPVANAAAADPVSDARDTPAQAGADAGATAGSVASGEASGSGAPGAVAGAATTTAGGGGRHAAASSRAGATGPGAATAGRPSGASASASASTPPSTPTTTPAAAAVPTTSRKASVDRYLSGARRRQGAHVLDPATGTWMRDGPWTEWSEDGRKLVEGSYRDGEKTGIWRAWHANGRPRSEETFEAGRSTGAKHSWHSNGQLASRRDELRTADGHVLWIEDAFYPNGAKRSRHHLLDGVRHGPSQAWHASRQPSETGAWAQGHKEGIWLYWDDQGRELGREIWVDGALRGQPRGAPANAAPADP